MVRIWGGARDAMAGARELVEEVRDGMEVVRPEVAEECARQIRASEGGLARIGVRLSEAVPTLQPLPQEHLLHLPIRQVRHFGYRDKQCLNFKRVLMPCLPEPNPNPQSPDQYPCFRWLQRYIALP
jgi:hypothetical protein